MCDSHKDSDFVTVQRLSFATEPTIALTSPARTALGDTTLTSRNVESWLECSGIVWNALVTQADSYCLLVIDVPCPENEFFRSPK